MKSARHPIEIERALHGGTTGTVLRELNLEAVEQLQRIAGWSPEEARENGVTATEQAAVREVVRVLDERAQRAGALEARRRALEEEMLRVQQKLWPEREGLIELDANDRARLARARQEAEEIPARILEIRRETEDRLLQLDYRLEKVHCSDSDLGNGNA